MEEINFVSGYYHQNGNHSAVTGGIGTERLTDFSNTIELKLSKYDRRLRKHSLNFELGIDHYTSASSDKIDPSTISSASHADTRIYPSVSWSRLDATKGKTIGFNLSASTEYDYTSFGIGASFAKTSKDNNREFNARAQAYFDTWMVIHPIELRQQLDRNKPSPGRNSFNAAFSLSQAVNQKLQVALVAEPTFQQGLLATRYQRVYFAGGGLDAETLPDNRFKLPVGIRANYFASDRLIVRSFYRYYQDNWCVRAHTIDLETPIKVSPFWSISPYYRFYTQTAASYFAPYAAHKKGDAFFTSDYDLSQFNSQYFGAGMRFVPANGVLGIEPITSAEIRGGHYIRNDGLSSNNLALHLTFK